MLTELSQYGALFAKTHAMRGKRLTGADYARMLDMRSVTEVAQYLEGHPAYVASLSGFEREGVHRGALEAAVRNHWFSQYLTLFHYVPREDAALLRYPVLRAEMEQIMAFLRLASVGRAEEYTFTLPRFFDRHSRIRYQALSRAVTYDDLLEAVSRTDFYPALRRLRKEDGAFPAYILVESAMQSYYFTSVFSLIDRRAHGETRALLRDLIGLQADMINVSAILRILRSFSALKENVFSYLLPVTHKLGPAFLRTLLQSPDTDAAFALMQTSPYGKFFATRRWDTLYDYSAEICYDFAKKHFSGIPSVHTALIFISLQELELKNLIHVIESVRYGVPLEQIRGCLVGLDL